MPLSQLGGVELGGLQQLDLPDQHILKGEDTVALLLDLLSDGVGDELGDQLLDGGGGDLVADDLEHLLADLTDLGGLGVASPGNLTAPALGESQEEDTEGVSIRGLDIDGGLDQGVPLTDKRAELVSGQIHSVERGEAVGALDVLDLELHLPESLVLILVQVSEAALDDPAPQSIRGDLGTLGAVDNGLTDVGVGEEGRGPDVIPVLLGEGVDDLLFKTLLFAKLLVLADGHDYLKI